MKKILMSFLFAVVLFFSGFFVLNHYFSDNLIIKNNDESESIVQNKIEEAKSSKVVIYAVGDIMLDRGVKYMVYKYGNGDYKFSFANISSYLNKADIVFGNLESQISDKGNKIGTVNSFRAEPKAMEGLVSAGFNIVSVANNHSFDYNTAALKDSFERLKSADIEYVGGGLNKEEAFGLKIIEKNDVKIGFLAYCSVGAKGWAATDGNAGIAFLSDDNIEKIREDIKKAKEKVDILIVSSHAGEEYQTEENEYQSTLYQSFIESGADIVLGHHPHVVQPVKGYLERYIAYSLGNFIFDQGFSEDTMKGGLLEITIEDKKIKDVSPKQIIMNKQFQPEIVD